MDTPLSAAGISSELTPYGVEVWRSAATEWPDPRARDADLLTLYCLAVERADNPKWSAAAEKIHAVLTEARGPE